MNSKHEWIYKTVLSIVVLILFFSCNKNETGIEVPSLKTTAVSNITETTAICNGEISDNGGAEITACGICWNNIDTPTIANHLILAKPSSLSFSCKLTALKANTKYFVRAYATNSGGTSYGSTISFMTNKITTTDIDGNKFDTVRIDNQLWMAENLKVTHYRNGDPIDSSGNSDEWAVQFNGAYCLYNNKYSNDKIYGKIYNYYTVIDERQVCPTGWHVPELEEWLTLITYLSKDNLNNDGGKLKEIGTKHWNSPNAGATNETGFNALPGGYRRMYGDFGYINNEGIWWCSNKVNNRTHAIVINSDSTSTYGYGLDDKTGCSIRCIKD